MQLYRLRSGNWNHQKRNHKNPKKPQNRKGKVSRKEQIFKWKRKSTFLGWNPGDLKESAPWLQHCPLQPFFTSEIPLSLVFSTDFCQRRRRQRAEIKRWKLFPLLEIFQAKLRDFLSLGWERKTLAMVRELRRVGIGVFLFCSGDF